MADPVAVTIICPTEVEAGFLRSIASGRATIVVSGVGPSRVATALESIPSRNACVLVCGVAGGLAPVGHASRISRVVNASGEPIGAPRWASPWFPTQTESILCGVDAPVCAVDEKRTLADSSGASVVDCESHAVAGWATATGAPWGVVRGISDPWNESLPEFVTKWTDSRGRTRNLSVLIDLAKRPGMIPRIARLASSTRHAMRAVAESTDHLLDMILATPRADANSAAPRVGSFPLDVDRARRVLVVGGTFDPPHRAHVELSAHAARETGCDTVLVIPAARSPHKSTGPVASDAQRVAMLELAYRTVPGAAISTTELDRSFASTSDPSFTVDTLAALRGALAPDAEIRLFMGSDQAESFHRWREPDRILAFATPAVVLRPPVDSPDALIESLRPNWDGHMLDRWRSWIVGAPASPISATGFRSAPDARMDDLPDSVAAYIRARRVYGNPRGQ